MHERSAQSTYASSMRQPMRNIGLCIGIIAILGLSLSLTSGLVYTWVSVVVLGIVEGVTEFLPISSTAHLLISADLLNFQNSIGHL